MMKDMPNMNSPLMEFINALTNCRECGAVLLKANVDRHIKWHQKMDKAGT